MPKLRKVNQHTLDIYSNKFKEADAIHKQVGHLTGVTLYPLGALVPQRYHALLRSLCSQPYSKRPAAQVLPLTRS